MGQDQKTLARSKPTLPAGAPRFLLTAVAEHVTISTETTKPVTLIGSRRDCDLSIGQSDVSKVHCALVNTGTKIVVVDLCTRSGTFVNGKPVAVAPLNSGDELRVGSEPVGVWFLEPEDGSVSQPPDSPEANLELQRPLRLIGAGLSCALESLPAVVGRRSACQIVLDTPDVSLTHALLFLIGDQPAVFDLGSRSGTYLNDQRVGLSWLCDGDVLSIGGEKLALTFGSVRQVPSSPAANVEPDELPVETDEVVDVDAPDSGPPPVPKFEELDAETIALQALQCEEEAALDQRETALDEREARLAAIERELANKHAELVEREKINAEAAKRLAAFVGALGEAWRAFGFGGAPAARPAEPETRRPMAAPPENGTGRPPAGGPGMMMGGEHLPAPLVDRAMFRNPSLE